MSVTIIDLTSRSRSCTENPLVRLQRELKSMRENSKIKVVTDPSIVPIEVIEIMASKHGAEVKVLRRTNNVIEAEITKK